MCLCGEHLSMDPPLLGALLSWKDTAGGAKLQRGRREKDRGSRREFEGLAGFLIFTSAKIRFRVLTTHASLSQQHALDLTDPSMAGFLVYLEVARGSSKSGRFRATT